MDKGEGGFSHCGHGGRGVNFLQFCADVFYEQPLSTKFLEMFVTRLIDEFSYRISTQGIIIVVEGRACDKNIDYFRAIRAGTEVCLLFM